MEFRKIDKRGGKRKKSGAANNPGAAKLFKSPLTFKSADSGRNPDEAEKYRQSREGKEN